MLPTHLVSGEPAVVDQQAAPKSHPSEADPSDLEETSSVRSLAIAAPTDNNEASADDEVNHLAILALVIKTNTCIGP